MLGRLFGGKKSQKKQEKEEADELLVLHLPTTLGDTTATARCDQETLRICSKGFHLGTAVNVEGKLTSVPAEVWQLTKLADLVLIAHELTSLPSEIGLLTNLTCLNLTGNKLTTLPREIGRLTKLTRLFLRDNELQDLPAEIDQLTNLEELSLNFNRLKRLPSAICRFDKLRELCVDGNPDLALTSAEFAQKASVSWPEFGSCVSLIAQFVQSAGGPTNAELFAAAIKELDARSVVVPLLKAEAAFVEQERND